MDKVSSQPTCFANHDATKDNKPLNGKLQSSRYNRNIIEWVGLIAPINREDFEVVYTKIRF